MQEFSKTPRGDRIGVLLLHGLCGSPSELRFIANGLARSGARVVCPTIAGHGGTREELSSSSWQDWYRSAEEALLGLAETCDKVVVGGLSTGAVLALMLAARHTDKVQGVTLYSPTLWLSGRSVPWYLPVFRLLPSRRIANLFSLPVPGHVGIKDQRVRDFIRQAIGAGRGAPSMPSTPGGAALERRRLCKKVMGLIPRITQPVLIIHARDDDYAGLDNASWLERQLAGAVDLVVLEDSFHMITVDRERHVVLDRTLAFVDRVRTAAALPAIPAKPALAASEERGPALGLAAA